ncbi:MAG: dTDP-4-dehydrorhamnose reductase [Oscillospiraceae bacterium]
MKIIVTGSKGMLATQVIRDLQRGYTELGTIPSVLKNATLTCCDYDVLDITDGSACLDFIEKEQPDILINCAAYTNVDACETNQSDAFKVNALGPRNLAIACEKVGAKLVHISTDYVFSGEGSVPFCEYDRPDPQSVYGKTKLSGEEFVKQYCKKSFIIRTAWLYGYNGKNFVKTIVSAGAARGALTVVNDQMGNPTNAADLSHHILKVAAGQGYGTYHCTGKGECSWYDFACEIIRLSKVKATLTPCTTAQYNSPTKRPAYSSLDNMMLRVSVGDEMRPWQEALAAYFENQQK